MKTFICADIHGNVRALDAVLTRYRDEYPCDFLFLGDCVGYGAHPDACLERVLNLPRATLLIGNHEAVLLSERDDQHMNPIAAEAIRWTFDRVYDRFGKKIRERFVLEHEDGSLYAVHSSPLEPEEWPYIFTQFEADEIFFDHKLKFHLCFVGHTHFPALFSAEHGEMAFTEDTSWLLDPNDRYIINPGSVGQPRDRDPRAACCIYDHDAGTITLHRCAYDVQTEARDIIEAGLPEYLALRLLKGA